jgi:lysophospholipase L1-like esterase
MEAHPMQTVILVGDSIRMGYQTVARIDLHGAAELWAPEQNGGTSTSVLHHLYEWVISRTPDVVHINAGLHDIKRPFGSTQWAVPLPRYQHNVETILRRLIEETDATVIWAMTTPVNHDWHHVVKGFDRFEADVVTCNRAAAEVAAELGVRTNDLFSAVMDAGRDRLLREDGVHFTDEGSELLGHRVAGAIRRVL